ncbi:hypothetical protein [Streptomyces vinaceus]|uniref:hypothetical protein n=1 Tax=Streptomyces vinaceus TaxID=1960 RepID=UPI0036A9A5DA
MNWQGHYHGYGPWVGDIKDYSREGERRPGPAVEGLGTPGVLLPEHKKQVDYFIEDKRPPMMTAHWLLKRGQTSSARTWTDPAEAISWLEIIYAENPPYERPDNLLAYAPLSVKVSYAHEVLPLGVDVTWAYYLKSKSFLSASVVACKNRLFPNIPCPLPPA